MACFYLENLNQKKQWELQISGCQAFKNILGLQIITSLLAISTIYFYSDQEYTFPEGVPVRPPSAGNLGCWKLATSYLSLKDTELHS